MRQQPDSAVRMTKESTAVGLPATSAPFAPRLGVTRHHSVGRIMKCGQRAFLTPKRRKREGLRNPPFACADCCPRGIPTPPRVLPVCFQPTCRSPRRPWRSAESRRPEYFSAAVLEPFDNTAIAPDPNSIVNLTLTRQRSAREAFTNASGMDAARLFPAQQGKAAPRPKLRQVCPTSSARGAGSNYETSVEPRILRLLG